jgi:hypothetical protein
MRRHLRDGSSWSGIEWLYVLYHHSPDDNFIGLFTIPNSTTDKMSMYHSLYFQQQRWTRSATFLSVFMMLLSMTSNTSSITPRSFRRPFKESHNWESHNSYRICNATWQQLKLTTDCIHRRLGLLCSPISCSQLKAISWIAGFPEHKTQWQVDAQIYTPPRTATMSCQNSNGMSSVSQLLTRETNWNYMRRAASILRIAKRGQFGTT